MVFFNVFDFIFSFELKFSGLIGGFVYISNVGGNIVVCVFGVRFEMSGIWGK